MKNVRTKALGIFLFLIGCILGTNEVGAAPSVEQILMNHSNQALLGTLENGHRASLKIIEENGSFRLVSATRSRVFGRALRFSHVLTERELSVGIRRGGLDFKVEGDDTIFGRLNIRDGKIVSYEARLINESTLTTVHLEQINRSKGNTCVAAIKSKK